MTPRLLLVPALLAACSDDPATAPIGYADGPLYAMMTQVYGVDDRTVYVAITDSVDVPSIDLDRATEFPGVANIESIGGNLYVSSGQEPVITRYLITEDLALAADGSVSFASFGLPEDGANFYGQWIVDDQTAYLSFDLTSRVVWNPQELAITGTLEDGQLPLERDGLLLEAGGNRNATRFPGAVLRPFFYHDTDWLQFTPTTPVAIQDPVATTTTFADIPCAAAAISTRDEAGYTYFSSWDYTPALALYGDGPPPCVARFTPDNVLDEAFTTDFTEITGGRYSMNVRYVGGGKAVAAVLHDEELDVDFTGEFDPAIIDTIYTAGPHWKLWLFDVEARTGAPIAGIDLVTTAGYAVASLDGRTFVFVPFADYSKSRVYELGADGTATAHFDVVGDVFKWIKIR